ncbi:MAG TPA: flagellar hook-basal body complex protein [Patescibacteria group bacterium]|nr:flagellar hook-basal body complex protein [Patescibacteria group bacterium]
MLLSLYSGVSGLKAQQTKLNVIGNNIANTNTTGYKAQTVSFSDVLSQTLSSASGASSTSSTGGSNAKQVGTGVSVAATTTNTTVGSTQTTGNSTDVALTGDGYFIVQGGASTEYQFTRAGDFSIDADGNVTVDGLLVCGWSEYSTLADGTYKYNTDLDVESLNLYTDANGNSTKTIAPEVTTTAAVTGMLAPSESIASLSTTTTTLSAGSTVSAGTTVTIGTTSITYTASYTLTASATLTTTTPITSTTSIADLTAASAEATTTTTMTLYDSLGDSFTVKASLYKIGVDSTTNQTTYKWVIEPTDSTALTAALSSSGDAMGTITFDSSGKVIASASTTSNITFTPSGTYAGASAFTVAVDFNDLTYYTSTTTSSLSVDADGCAAGELEDFTIDSSGVISGTYSNGETRPLGMLALATFTNPAGLEKIGDNLYVTTANSGDYTGGVAAGTSGTGTLATGMLEMSNVDLSSEFAEMMITQRAYQAASKVITTSDNILETLVGMVR